MGGLLGRTLRGKYRVVRHLGQGAMSDVYLVELHQHPGVKFALKVLKPHLVHQTDLGRRFRDEGVVLDMLDHPGIVKVYESFDEGGAICMVLAFVDGESLGERIRAHGAMAPYVALPMFRAVLRALDYAHQRGVVHRDLKPSNILIDAAGRPHLCDFGIAKQVGQGAMTAIGITLGTPQYMSPEQIQAPRTIDHRSDLYSAGIVLYEMLTGKVPFGDNDTASDFQVLQQQVHAEPPDPRLFNPGLDPALVEILRKALRKEPGKRMQGSVEFAQAIERVERGVRGTHGEATGSVPLDAAVASAGARRYAVYEHPTQGRAAVKVGMSWPALLFGPLWMVAKRLHGLAALWFVGETLIAVMIAVFAAQSHDDSLRFLIVLLAIVAIVIWVMPALRGNQWCEDALLRRGYVACGETRAASPQAALAGTAR